MSVFKSPTAVVKRIEKLQRDFLWQGKSKKMKISFVGLVFSVQI